MDSHNGPGTVLMDPSFPPCAQETEQTLDIFNITLARQQAEMEVRIELSVELFLANYLSSLHLL